MLRLLAAVAALALSTLSAQTPAPAKSALDKAAMEEYVRHLFVWGPNIKVVVADPKPAPMPGYLEIKLTASANGASQDEIFYVSPDGKSIVRGTVYDINKSPFAAELEKLKTDLSPSEGTPGAPVVIVLFSDFQCSYCRQLAKTLQENLLKTYPKEVRLYFKDFPIDQIHPWARPASIAGRCVFRQNPQAFWAYHDWIFDKQTDITIENLRAKIMEWAGAKSLDTMLLGRCFDNKSTDAEVNKTIAEAQSLRVNSTPTMFLNGRTLSGAVPWPTLKQIIDFEIDHQKKTGAGGEQCCEIKLSPLPTNKQ